MADLYTVSSRYYDEAYATLKDLRDVPFYMELARRTGGPVLELGCGTGRVLLPIARAGIAVHGVDGSPAMLEELSRKLAQEPDQVRERVTLSAGDLRNFRSERKYPLVIIPFRPLQHMYTVEDQVAALRTAAFHLEENGLLAFDVFYPRFESLLSGVGEESLEMQWTSTSNPTLTIHRYFRKDAVDKINQNFTATFIYRTFEGDKLLREETAPLRLAWYTYPHLVALFLLAGLTVVEEYGSADKASLDDDAKEMFFVLRKAK
jgi:SAM-dependent methyltransferase